MRTHRSKTAWVWLALLWPVAAVAHVKGGEAIGFVSGAEHPVSGLDHVLAMIAVGLWARNSALPRCGCFR